jgi:preprotein translocase subunit SecG
MFNLMNLLASDIPFKSSAHASAHMILSVAMIILMAIAAVTAIVLVLLQPSNSSGIDALGGSSETFFGKNKGKSIEAKMKKWTWVCLAILVVFAITFYILQIPALWV